MCLIFPLSEWTKVATTSLVTLKLVQERKIRKLVPNHGATKRFDAGGVFTKASYHLVVFDDCIAPQQSN